MNAATDTGAMTPIDVDGLSHWRLAQDDGDVAWLCFDCAGEGTNTLSAAVIEELATAVKAIEELRLRAPR